MNHLKKFQVEDLSEKYGSQMVGYVANEHIRKGEKIFACNEPDCRYKHSQTRFNRAQIDQLNKERPQLNDYIHR